MINTNDINITILFDNQPYNKDLQTLWGFSCLIETPKETILFDTGSNGRVLLKNMQRLQCDAKKIDTLFLTHQHWDHIGGFDSVIELYPNIDIVLTSAFSQNLIQDLDSMVQSVTIVKQKSCEISDNIHSTGVMGESTPEQSLIIDSDQGLIVITGCAHSGIVEIATKAQMLFNKKIHLLLGGFHLFRESESKIEKVIKELKKIGIEYVAPTHCTGEMAVEKFSQSFGDKFIVSGVGKRFYKL